MHISAKRRPVAPAFGAGGTRLRQRQRRVLKAAWGNAPGHCWQKEQGLKARAKFLEQDSVAPNLSNAMKRAVVFMERGT